MGDLDTAKTSRKARKGVVTRFINNARQAMAEDEDHDSIAEHMNSLKLKFKDFEKAQDEYHGLLEEEAAQEESEQYFYGVQKDYIATLNEIKNWLKEQNQEQKADVKNEQSKATSNSDIVSMMNLPKVELESYDGDPLSYHNFFAIFNETVHSVVKDGSIRLTRLLQYTSGKAKDAIRSCALVGGAEGYKKACDILAERFGNDHLISEKIIENLRHDKQVKSSNDLLQFADDLSNSLAMLTKMSKLHEVSSQSFILQLVNHLQPHLRNRWRKLAMDMKEEKNEYPSFSMFVEFVKKRANEANDPIYGYQDFKRKVPEVKKSSSFSTTANMLQQKPVRYVKPCVLCKQSHRLFHCDVFKAMKPPERFSVVTDNKLCKNCLLDNHSVESCRKDWVCSVPNCGLKHSKFIHLDNVSSNVQSGSAHSNVCDIAVKCDSDVYVPVVNVTVNDACETHALLDTASTNTFCTRKLVNALGVNGVKADYVLSTLNSSEQKLQSELVSLTLKSVDGAKSLRLSNVFVVDSIPARTPKFDASRYPHLSCVPLVNSDTEVQILIGQDHAEALIPLHVKQGSRGDPYAMLTMFGWCLNGPAQVRGKVSRKVINHFISAAPIEEQVNKLWNLENEGLHESKQSWSQEDHEVVKLWDSKSYSENGHYVIPIPWKKGVMVPNNVCAAMSRLQSLQTSLTKKGLMLKYSDEMLKLLNKGYAEIVPSDDIAAIGKTWYLPHHPVVTEKKPGKVRIVFDCAAKFQGESLNDKCMRGPDLNNRLLHVLWRFRQHDIAVTSDIEAMYYQVKVPIADRNALRFLWFGDDGEVIHYRMTSHVFGGVWCSSVATYALLRTVDVYGAGSPLAAEAVRKSFYVDDCLQSVNSPFKADEVVQGTKMLLAKGGFNLTKFIVNNPEVLEKIPEEERASEAKQIGEASDSRALGVVWDFNDDDFRFVASLDQTKTPTRRSLLSMVSSIFDPLGLISPLLIPGKLIFQEATRLKIPWDVVIPDDLIKKWCTWVDSMSEVESMRINRCVKPRIFDESYKELHHFSDASQQAYGTCSYLRCINQDGEIHTALVTSKGKVAPIKSTTIPRLELQAAVLSAQIDYSLRQELELDLGPSYFWVDSEIVVKCIKNESRRFHVYVANRLNTIRKLTDPSSWHHIPGRENPADVVSRGQTLSELDQEKWFKGPAFLLRHKSEWNLQPMDTDLSDEDPDVKRITQPVKQVVHVCATTAFDHPMDVLIQHYSSWYRLKKALCWILRVKNTLLKKSENDHVHLSVSEMQKAESIILAHVQNDVYASDIRALCINGQVYKSSSLRDLCPVLVEGVLCVGGRLSHGKLDERVKHPVILPHRHVVSKLIVAELHNVAHLGTEWTLSLLREKYWITHARSLIKSVSRSCVLCKKWYASPCCQKMADLPPERLEAYNSSFKFTGIDCFGPFPVKYGRGEIKRYGCIFTCFSTRAIHLEKLDTLECDSFLNGLQRFIARRGAPSKIWCDNGTNFVAGYNELNSVVKQLKDPKVLDFSLKRNIEWSFNPPHASHMGGVWERLIRTIRKVLTAVLQNQRLTDEILQTALCEVEAIVNSRPITKVSSESNDVEALTPNHLLLLRNGPCAPPGLFVEDDKFRRRYKYVQYMADEFWKKWLKCYIPELQKRCKWTETQRNVEVSDLVLLVDENVPRALWPLGIITEVFCGSDNLVRSVKVKTRASEFVRPITKVVLLKGS